jgi:hypothetical protein
MEATMQNSIDLMGSISSALKVRGADMGSFDSVIYELVEFGVIEPQAAVWVASIWAGDTIQDCEDCQEWANGCNVDESTGMLLCPECFTEEAN